MLEKRLGEIVSHLWTKKKLKKVGAKEMVQCLNDNHFLGLDIDIALASSPIWCHTTRNAPNIALNKSKKIPCNQMPEITTE